LIVFQREIPSKCTFRPNFSGGIGASFVVCHVATEQDPAKEQIPERHLALVLDPLGVGTANVGATVEMPSTVFEKSLVVRCLPV